MNTPTNAYIKNFSSGTIVAMLVLSGLLFLVPVATTVHAAQNATQPTLTPSPTVVFASTATAYTLTVKNPISNAYAIIAFTVSLPSGWTFGGAPSCGPTFLGVVTIKSASAIECTSSGIGNQLNPGFSTTLNLGTLTGPASPATSPAVTGSISTSMIDTGSNPAAYPGPSLTETSITAGTTISMSLPVTGNFVAGSAPLTATATVSSGQQGVPVSFSFTNGGYPSAGFTSSLSPASGTTGATGSISSTFTPSNKAGDATSITATIATLAALTGASGVVTTVAASPSAVTFYLSAGAFPSTHYLSIFGTTTHFVTGSTTYSGAYDNTGDMTWAVSDQFGNPASGLSGVSGSLIAATPSTGAAYFDVQSPMLNTFNTGGATTGTVPKYVQTGTYGTVGKLTSTVSGFYGVNPFSVSGFSGNLVTGTFQIAVQPTPGAYGSGIYAGVCNPGDCTTQAGSSFSVSATYGTSLAHSQSNVPLTLYALTCGDSANPQTGTFTSSGTKSVSLFSNSTGQAAASFKADTFAGDAVRFISNVSAPTDATPGHWLGASGFSGCVDTIPGAAAQFVVQTYWDSHTNLPNNKLSTSGTAGATYFITVSLADVFGNAVTNSEPNQIQLTLSSTVGVLSATNVYIATGYTGTGSFGPISLTIPSSTALGTVVTLTATGPVNGVIVHGVGSFTIVSPLPTIGVKSPVLSAGVFYTMSNTVVFTGSANVSKGLPGPLAHVPVDIASVGFKVNTNHWLSAAIATNNKVTWSVAASFAAGLNTIQFNATDNTAARNTVVSPAYQLLVDPGTPTITFPSSTTSNTGSVTVTITAPLGDLNTNSITGTWGGVAIPASSISWTGSNTLGSSSAFSVTFSGLSAATQALKVTAATLAGGSATASQTFTITVLQNQTFTSSGSGLPTVTTQGGFQGVAVTFVNNGPATSSELVCFELFNSASQVAQGPICFGGPVSGGASIPAFFSFQSGLAHGSYTAKVYVSESGNAFSPVYSVAVNL